MTYEEASAMSDQMTGEGWRDVSIQQHPDAGLAVRGRLPSDVAARMGAPDRWHEYLWASSYRPAWVHAQIEAEKRAQRVGTLDSEPPEDPDEYLEWSAHQHEPWAI